MTNILNQAIKYVLYALVFLFPLFFLPGTVAPLAASKQVMVAVLAFLLLILWVIKVVSTGKLWLLWNKIVLGVVALLVILGISTALSASSSQSFWGTGFEPDTLFCLILYCLVFLLFANLIRKKKEVLKIISIFLVSSGILALLFLIQTLIGPIFPWDFAKSSGFNPVGTVQALSLFLGGALLILISLQRAALCKICRGLPFVILGILLFVSVFLINYWVAWVMLALGCLLIIWLSLSTSNVDKQAVQNGGQKTTFNKGIILPICLLALALVFIFIRIPVNRLMSLPVEISPSYKATFNIAEETMLQGPKNFVLGSGPATFVYDYDLYHSQEVNVSSFWAVRFSQGIAFLPTLLATGGLLAILAALFLLAVFIYHGLKPKGASKEGLPPDAQGLTANSPTLTSIAVGGVFFLLAWFFYPANFCLMLAGFLMVGLWVALSQTKPLRVQFTGTSPWKSFLCTLVCVFLVVASVAGIYTAVKNYAGALAYVKGLRLINDPEPELDQGIAKLQQAANLDKKALYFRDLSQAFLLKINQVLQDPKLSQEEMQAKFQEIVSEAESSAQTATRVEAENSQNWLQLGNVYENLAAINIVQAGDLAVVNFEKAKVLAPQNPQMPLNIGRVYKAAAERTQAQINVLEGKEALSPEDRATIESLRGERKRISDIGLEELRKAVQLKPNFVIAYYLMAQVYELQGEKNLALQSYSMVLQLEPGNETAKNKLEELTETEEE